MDVEVQGAAEALDRGDGAHFGEGDVDGARAATHPSKHGADEEAAHATREVTIERERVAQPDRDGEDPLPDRDAREHAIDEVRRGVGHPAPAAGRADPASLATERNQDVFAAVVAVHAGEAVRKDPAAQAGAQIALDEARQAGAAGTASRPSRALRATGARTHPKQTTADFERLRRGTGCALATDSGRVVSPAVAAKAEQPGAPGWDPIDGLAAWERELGLEALEAKSALVGEGTRSWE